MMKKTIMTTKRKMTKSEDGYKEAIYDDDKKEDEEKNNNIKTNQLRRNVRNHVRCRLQFRIDNDFIRDLMVNPYTAGGYLCQ